MDYRRSSRWAARKAAHARWTRSIVHQAPPPQPRQLIPRNTKELRPYQFPAEYSAWEAKQKAAAEATAL